MKVILMVLAASLLLSRTSGSAEFSRHVSSETISENRGGQVLLIPRSNLSKRIEAFAVRHGADPSEAAVIAEILATKDHPRVLAAIAARESHFDLHAIGAAKEIGAFQQHPVHGHPGRTWSSQSDAAERMLNDLVAEHHGQLVPAVTAYNGAGPGAREYCRAVMAMARSI